MQFLNTRKNKKGIKLMKIILNRQEIEEALQCFINQKGIEAETVSATITKNEAIISLDPIVSESAEEQIDEIEKTGPVDVSSVFGEN
jgi:hypothetical protein